MRQKLCWDYFAFSWIRLVEVVMWQVQYAETFGWVNCWRCHGQLSRTCVPNLSCDYFNRVQLKAKSPQQLFCLTRKNRHSTKMYVVHHNTLSNSYRKRIVWFQPKQDSDRIRILIFKNRIGSDSKNSLSDHLCCFDFWKHLPSSHPTKKSIWKKSG